MAKSLSPVFPSPQPNAKEATQFGGIKFIHSVGQPYYLVLEFLSFQTETLLNNNYPSLNPLNLWLSLLIKSKKKKR